jgi:hypothetical protein
MSPSLRFALGFAATVGVFALLPRAQGDEPALPTDGIDAELPGPLALPATLPGPGRSDLVRFVAVDLDAREEAATLAIVVSYGETESAGSLLWSVRITSYDRARAAHEALHALLNPKASGPLSPWNERWQRVTEAPGLLLRHSSATGCDYAGVLRQTLVTVSGRLRKDAAAEERETLVARAVAEGKDLAMRAFSTVRDAPPAIRPMAATVAERVTIDHEPAEAGIGGRIVVRLTPGAALADDQPVRLWVVSGADAQDVRTTPAKIRKAPLAVSSPAKGNDPNGASVRILRVVEDGPLALEEVQVTVGACGTRVVKQLKPPSESGGPR